MRRSRKSAISLSLLLLLSLSSIATFNYLLTLPTHQADDLSKHRFRMNVSAMEEFVAGTPHRPHEFYYYNVVRSDEIGGFRAPPDLRDGSCPARRYQLSDGASQKMSVVVVFYNEARSTLLRTIMSIYRQTPAQYLHEIILLDDASEDIALLPALRRLDFPPFTESGSAVLTPKVVIKIQRNVQRQGLIESRNRGARLATGDYLVFLDSHCEVNAGWAEPLLEQVMAGGRDGSRVAASPVLDSIDVETFAYKRTASNLVGGFDWSLHFHWLPHGSDHAAGQADTAKAFRSPIFAGGIFMISRNWFFKLNSFNSLLKIWGGESIEFSIKLWLCGGQIMIVPCSRVAHLFREEHPFRFPDGNQETFLRNAKVIAESWLDVYKQIFYAAKPAARHAAVNISHAEIDGLRSRLQCRPFEWYLRNVLPQLRLPNENFTAHGTLRCAERCLRTTPGAAANRTQLLLMGDCFSRKVTHWQLNRQGGQVQAHFADCLGVAAIRGRTPPHLPARTRYAVEVQRCRAGVREQQWRRRSTQLINGATNLCLDNLLNDAVAVSFCRNFAPTQSFHFSYEFASD